MTTIGRPLPDALVELWLIGCACWASLCGSV
jgi:hypothetical protein